MQMFRMREYVCVGTPDQVMAFREQWLEKGRDFARELALPHEVNVANDPFFGRGGRVMASSQRELGLKFELLVPIESGDEPTACMSFNYHQDHFASMWESSWPAAKRRTPPASVLAWSGWRSHCLNTMDSTWTPGRPRSAPLWLSRVGRTRMDRRDWPRRIALAVRADAPIVAPKRKAT